MVVKDSNTSSNTKTTSAENQKEKCLDCSRFLINLARHKKCVKRKQQSFILNNSIGIQGDICNSMSVLDSVRVQSNSDVAISSDERNETVNLDHSSSTVLKDSRKTQCPHCIQFFVSILRHKKCRKRESVCSVKVKDSASIDNSISIQSNVDNSVSTLESLPILSLSESSTSDNNRSLTDNTSPSEAVLGDLQKTQCKNCFKFFVNILRHKKCRKQQSVGVDQLATITDEDNTRARNKADRRRPESMRKFVKCENIF